MIPPAAPPPVEGETERCASCGRGPGYVAVSYDGGATVKRECVRTDCRATEPVTPPVVGDQPEETDIVNDETHLRALKTVLDAAMSDWPGADEFRMPFRSMLPANWRSMREELERHAARLDAANSPAAGEVRVEWGVRWHVDSTWSYAEDRQAAEAAMRRVHTSWTSNPTLVSREVTTSAWQPVTDERQEGQA